MSASLGVPSNCVPDSTDAENQIREIFSQHWEKIKHEMMTTSNQIETWRQTTIDEINKYANEQIRILEGDYARRNVSFNEKYEENLEITRAYCSAQNVELFNELQNACRLLEFQVAQLENVIGTMPFLKVITVEEQIERKKKEHFDVLKAEDGKSEEKSMIESTDKIQYNQSANGNESRNLASSISNERQ